MTEQELVALAQAGDQDAFAQLVEANQNKIYTLALRMTGNSEDAADLAQEAFLKVWRALPDFQGESGFSTWLYRLTSNLCIDFLRRENRRRSIASISSLDDEEGPLPTDVPDRRFTPEDELERRELRTAVDRGLRRLSDEHRQVLALRAVEGLSYTEIAGVLDLEVGTVKSRIARARSALRTILLKDGNFSPPTASNQMKHDGKE